MISLRSKKFQQGLSLIELLIAMVIGLFLLGGITTTYIQSKQSSIKRDEYSILQDNGRVALEFMSTSIAHTGYVAFPSGVISPSSFITKAVVSNTCDGGGQNVVTPGNFTGKLTEDGASGASDSIGVIYLGDANLSTDCAGGSLPVACQLGGGNTDSDSAKIYSSFFVQNNSLQCAGSRTTTIEPIADDIENIQFLYGVDADDDRVVDRYINATQMGTFANNVISIQIGVLVRSEREVKSEAEVIKYSLLDQAITSPNDRFLRAVFTTTVNLRNTL